MKNKFLILVGILICINSCRMPADPLGEIKIIKRLDTIDTGGNCRDLDVDNKDNILVAAANYNGYFVYKINYEINNSIDTLIEIVHMGPDDLDVDLGDNRIESIVLSKENDIAFILDKYENIWLYKYGSGAEQYGGGQAKNMKITDTACLNYGGSWLSVAIDDKSDSIGVYFLLNHHSAELLTYCISKEDDDYVELREWDDCLNIQNYFKNGYADQEACEDAGYVWKDPGCKSGGDYAQYSTSIVWTKLTDVAPEDNVFYGDPDCEYIINQGKIAGKIFFNDGVLSMTYGELGVRSFKQSDENLCWGIGIGETEYSIHYEDYMTQICGVDSDGNKTCENDEDWLEEFGNGVWDFDEDFIDCGTDGIGNTICENEEAWDETFGNGTWDDASYDNDGNLITQAEELVDCSFTHSNLVDCCKAVTCPESDATCYLDRTEDGFIESNGYPGLGGVYSSKGGIIPQISFEFDTPGEVEIIYSIDQTIFAGLSHSNGFTITKLNDDGSTSDPGQFATGYSIRGIHEDNGLLALAAGHDGILLYNWNGGVDVSFIGKIETSYANNVKVAGSIIFAATEDGIEVIQIAR